MKFNINMDNTAETDILFATGGYDHSISMWQPSTATCISNFQHSESQVNALAFSSDGKYLAAAGYKRVRLYHPSQPPNPIATSVEFMCNVNAIGFNDKSQWIYTCGEDGSAKIFDLRSKGNQVIRLFQDKYALCSMILERRHQYEVVLANERGQIHVWDLRMGTNTPTNTLGAGVSASSNNNNSSSGGVGNGLTSNSKNSTTMHWPDTQAGAINSLAMNSEGTMLAALNCRGCLMLYSIPENCTAKMVPRSSTQAHSSYGLKVEFSPDCTQVVTCGADASANVLRTADLTTNLRLTISPPSWMWDCSFSADSNYLVTASSDGLARLWSLSSRGANLSSLSSVATHHNPHVSGNPSSGSTNNPVRVYHGNGKPLTCLAFLDRSLDGYYY